MLRPDTMAGDQAHASASEAELTVTVVGAVMIVLSVLAVVFRFYTRFHLKAVLWWDDWMALAAVVSAAAAGALVLAGKLSSFFDYIPSQESVHGELLTGLCPDSLAGRSRCGLAADRIGPKLCVYGGKPEGS